MKWIVKERRVRDAKTERQVRVRQLFSYFRKRWMELSLSKRVLWEEYSKYFRYIKKLKKSKGGIIPSHKGIMTGRDVYISTNLMLSLSGFPGLDKPTLGNISPPPSPFTNIVHFGTYREKIKFDIWLSSKYPVDCKAQVWVRPSGETAFPQLTKVIPIDTSHTTVEISKLRFRKKEKLEIFALKDLAPRDIRIQLRTIASNGKFSHNSALYLIELKP